MLSSRPSSFGPPSSVREGVGGIVRALASRPLLPPLIDAIDRCEKVKYRVEAGFGGGNVSAG